MSNPVEFDASSLEFFASTSFSAKEMSLKEERVAKEAIAKNQGQNSKDFPFKASRNLTFNSQISKIGSSVLLSKKESSFLNLELWENQKQIRGDLERSFEEWAEALSFTSQNGKVEIKNL